MIEQSPSAISIHLLGAAIFAALLAMPTGPLAQDRPVDFANFDCWKVRRAGDKLELDRLTSEGPVATVFQCVGRSCVNRAQIVARDGTTSEIFRYIYFPRDRNEYVSSWAMWREGEEAPAMHRSTVYQLVRCQETAPGG